VLALAALRQSSGIQQIALFVLQDCCGGRPGDLRADPGKPAALLSAKRKDRSRA
jgi:hypothetical protein